MHTLIRSVAVLCIAVLLGASPPKYIDKVADTPDFLQTDPRATFPGGGRQFCAPVAVSNSFMWLAEHGYGHLKPQGRGSNEAAQAAMVRTLASAEMMNTSLKDGTTMADALEGVDRYVGKVGYKCREIKCRGWRVAARKYKPEAQLPDPAWMKESIAVANSGVFWDVGWYALTDKPGEYRRVGGHWVTLVGYGEDEQGREAPDVFILKDPAAQAGLTPANEYVLLDKLRKGKLTGDQTGLPIRAAGYYQVVGGMHISKKAKCAILDAVVVVVLDRNDDSLPNDRYIALGLPSYDREWTGQDMAVAASKLQTLADGHPEQLPRFQSAQSGKVFARIVSPENLSMFRNRSVSVRARFPQALQCTESVKTIVKLYVSAFTADKVEGDDFIEIIGADLRVWQMALELMDEYVPTLSKDDPKYQARMDGIDRMRGGVATLVKEGIVSLTEERNYSTDSRLRLAKHCRETFPSIVPELSAPSQAEVMQRLKALADAPKLRRLQPELILLRDEVAAATKAAGQQ